MISFWNSKRNGLKNVLFQVTKVTGQSEIGKLDIAGDFLTDEDVMKIFGSLRITEELELRYRFSRSQDIPYNTKSILIWNLYCITPTHLSVMRKCTVIILIRFTLTDDDAKWFLESWKLGEYPNLEYLSIHSSSISINFTVFDLPSLHNPVDPHSFKKLILGETGKVYGAIDIQRADGAATKIHFDVKDRIVDLLVL